MYRYHVDASAVRSSLESTFVTLLTVELDATNAAGSAFSADGGLALIAAGKSANENVTVFKNSKKSYFTFISMALKLEFIDCKGQATSNDVKKRQRLAHTC